MGYYEVKRKEKAQRVVEEIIELYGMKSEAGDYSKSAKTMLDNLEEYEKAFEPYLFEDILQVIRKYWKFHSDKQRPSLKQILALLAVSDAQKRELEVVDVSKPICLIEKWQEDFDIVLRQACTLRIVYNPYWSDQPEVKDNFPGTYLHESDGSLSKKTYAMHWKECLKKAKVKNISEFEEISRFDNLMLDYTLAYRLGYLEF